MTSRSIFPQRLTQIDELTRPDHSYLASTDRCYYLGEYTAREGYAFSATNQLVKNLKIGIEHRGSARWAHKENAIRTAAQAFAAAIGPQSFAGCVLVPIPPSKAKQDPQYDDRMVRVLNSIAMPPLDARELLVQTRSTEAAHQSNRRLRPAELAALYSIDLKLVTPKPTMILVFDDVITTGCHFVAARMNLSAAFPAVPIVGIFVARRALTAS